MEHTVPCRVTGVRGHPDEGLLMFLEVIGCFIVVEEDSLSIAARCEETQNGLLLFRSQQPFSVMVAVITAYRTDIVGDHFAHHGTLIPGYIYIQPMEAIGKLYLLYLPVVGALPVFQG